MNKLNKFEFLKILNSQKGLCKKCNKEIEHNYCEIFYWEDKREFEIICDCCFDNLFSDFNEKETIKDKDIDKEFEKNYLYIY